MLLQPEEVEVVELVVVLGDVSSLRGARGPGDEVLHGARDEEGVVGDDGGPDADVAALDEGDGLLDGRRHLEADEDDGQAAAAERRCGNPIARR